jgi:predicted small lipoprotein YifL
VYLAFIDRIAMSSTLRVLLFAAVIAAPLAACGNKGPLVLPDKQEQQDKKKDQPANGVPPAQKTAADGAATQH